MSTIVIPEVMDPAVVDDLGRDFDLRYDPSLCDRPDDFAAGLAVARALVVRNRTRVGAGLLAVAPRLEVVGRFGVGLDNIDVEACAARGIQVLPATGGNALSVAEYVLGALLVLRRGAFFATPSVLAGEWDRARFTGHEIAGARLGIVGLGSIGRVVAAKARALGLEVAAVDPFIPAADPAWTGVARFAALHALLAAVDIVTLHVPLLPTTRHLIDAAALAAMRPGALLINAARGGVVDEAALAAALAAGRLGGAALDVFEAEPPEAAALARLGTLPNLILTPHVAGPTVQSNARIAAMVAASIRRVLAAGPASV
jgi:(S)-sulfolactate dehydrogenase